MAYPSTVSSFTNPLPTDRLNSPSHSSIETAQNTGLTEIQTFLGTVVTSAVGTIIYDVRSPQSDGGGHVQSPNKGGTGQTSYSKGDLIVGSASPLTGVTKFAVGLNATVLTADSSQSAGIKWAPVPGAPTMRVYSTASTLAWVKPSVLTYVVVEAIGGGGGGGNADGSGSSAGGGGGGAYSRKVYNASLLGATETVVIGAGGAGGATSGATGANGGQSTFSTGAASIFAGGGSGGVGDTSAGAHVTIGGGGGVASGGDINVPGDHGGTAIGVSAGVQSGGTGGATVYGGQNRGAVGDAAGGTGQSYGGGGGGASDLDGAGSGNNGGDGKSGVVIIWEY